MRRWFWWSAIALVGCTPKDAQLLPLPLGTRSVLLASIEASGAPPRLFGVEPPFALLTQFFDTERRMAIPLSRPLADLDLVRGLMPAALHRGEGRSIPGSLGLLIAEPGGDFVMDPGPIPYDLAPYDWSDLAQRGRCADGDVYVTSTCGSTLSLPLIEAAPPRLTDDAGNCPAGWTREDAAIDRGPTLGPLVLPRCVPPARLGCGPAQLQAAGDELCQPLSPPCDPRDPYSTSLPGTATISYVLADSPAGAAGDGTRARPFASLAEAMRSPRTREAQVLAIGRGTYHEDLELGGHIDVQGACTAGTVLEGSLVLRGHRGLVTALTVRAGAAPALSIDASRTELRGIWAASSTQTNAGLITSGSAVTAQRSVLESLGGGTWSVDASTLSLSRGELRGALALASSDLRLDDVATSAEQGAPTTVYRGSVELEACRIGSALILEESELSAARSWFVAAPAEPTMGVSSIVASRSSVRLRRSTFDHRQNLLECLGVGCTPSQVAVVGNAAQLDAEDVLLLAPTGPDAHGHQLSSINLGDGGPHLLRRILSTEGYSEGAITVADAEVSAADVAIHGAKIGWRLNCTVGCAKIDLKRLSVSRAQTQGIVLGGAFQGTAEDLGAYDCRTGISVEGRAGALDLRRANVVSAGPAAVGLERTLQGLDPTSFTATLRSLDLRGPFGIALSVEDDASLDLSDLYTQGAESGVVLVGPGATRRLRQATIEAERNGISVDSAVRDLRPLLDHVRIQAPRPIDRGAPQ